MTWMAVRVRPGLSRTRVIEVLFEMGSEGIHDAAEDVITHFPPNADISAIESAIMAADSGATISIEGVPDRDWAEEWKKGVRAHRVGKLTVTPPWLAGEFDAASAVVIEPEMAFGTGEHETTRGVMRLMTNVIRAGDTVADVGSGSSVLSIAAVKLGAKRAVGIEMDHDSIANAQQNIVRNDVVNQASVIEGDATILLPLIAPVRVVLANIISSVLLEMLPMIKAALSSDGEAVLSGMLLEERDMMMKSLGALGWNIAAEDAEGAWWSASITPV